MYPAEIVQPMKEELTENGFQELLTSDEVENQLKQQGTTLVMINSVCGCSAGTARPGVLMAVMNAPKDGNGNNLNYNVKDYQLIYPVPQTQLDLNPFLEQNPGY